MWKNIWDFVRLWVGGAFALLTLAANVIRAPANLETILNWLPAWIPHHWVRLGLGMIAAGYLIWLVILVKRGSIRPIPFTHPIRPHGSFQPIDTILEHIASVVGDGDKRDGYPLARTVLRQAASEGLITLQGKRWVGPNQHSSIATAIPLGFWRDHEIPIYAMHTASHHTELEGSNQTRGSEHTYYQLEALWLNVLKLWPKRQ